MFRISASTFRQLSRATATVSSSSSSSRAIPLRPITTNSNIPPENRNWGEKGSGWAAASQTGQTDQQRTGMGDQTKNPPGSDYTGGVPPVSNPSRSVTDKVKQMASDAAETVESGYEAAKNTARKGYEAAKDTYYSMKSDSGSDMKQMADDAADSAEEGWENAKQTAKKGYQAAKDAAKGTYYSMKSDSNMQQASDSAEEGWENAKDSVKKGYQAAKDTAQDTYYNMKSDASKVKEMSSEAAESVEDSYENAKQSPKKEMDTDSYQRTLEMEHKFHLQPDMENKYDPERY